MQGELPGKFHRWKPLIPVMNRFGSLGVPDQCVIAPPAPVFQFMHLHLDLNAFIAALNHEALLVYRELMGVSRIRLCRVCSKLLTSGCGGSLSNLLAERRHTFREYGARILSGAAKFNRAEVLVPLAVGRKWFGFDPLLQLLEIGYRDLALLNTVEQVAPESARQFSEAYPRQLRPFQRSRVSDLCPLRFSRRIPFRP